MAYVGLLGVVAAVAAVPRSAGAAATVASITGRGAIAFLRCSIHEGGSWVAGWRVGCVLLVLERQLVELGAEVCGRRVFG